MKNQDSVKHVKGESIFINDFTLPEGTLTASVFVSDIAHGRIKTLDLSESINTSGIHAILTYKDIPGENQIGGIIPDETLLAEDTVEFAGEPVALLVGDNADILRIAKEKIKISYETSSCRLRSQKSVRGWEFDCSHKDF